MLSRYLPKIAAIACLGIVAVTLAGWAFNLELLTAALPGAPKLVPFTAVGLALCATCLWLQTAPIGRYARSNAGLALIILGFGTASLLFHLLRWAPPPFMITPPTGQTRLSIPSPVTALLFLATGASLWLIAQKETIALAQGIAVAELLVTLLTLLGYISRDPFLYRLLPGKGTSILTTMAFVFLCAGILFLRASDGITASMTSGTPSAKAAGRLLALTFATPFILGIFSIVGSQFGLYPVETAISFVIWGLISLFTVVILHFAEKLHASDIARDRAEEDLRKAKDELEVRVEERTRELELSVTHDRLTGLPNRTLLIDRLQSAITLAQRNGRMIAVIYLDLDSFTYINTGLGSAGGDQILKNIAQRLSHQVRESEAVTRVGSDEFVILFTDLEGVPSSSARLAALLEIVRETMKVNGKEVDVTCSIGACFYPLDANEPEFLLRQANAAMHRAKQTGKDSIQFFAENRDSSILERIHLMADLKQAIAGKALFLHYQPKFDLIANKFVGAEALVRWRHPEKGLIAPVDFIPYAEETNLIISLGEYVLAQACLQVRIWQEAGLEDVAVAVNLSTRQFSIGNIVETVRKVLHETGIDPWRLELEITENSIIHDFHHVTGVMRALKRLGVSISIDDFGTGYSGLNTLRFLPADKLKIDKSFVKEIETSQEATAVALAVIAFAKSLRMKVIAEGVETAAQAKFLQQHGCDEIQGYLITCPLKAEQVQELVGSPFARPWSD